MTQKQNLSCADFTFPLLTHEQSLDLIAMLGFHAVDIGLFEERSHLWPSREFVQPTKARAIRRKLADRGLIASDIYLQVAPDFETHAANHPHAQIRQQARDKFLYTLEYAKECDARHVSALPGAYFAKESRRDSFQRCCDEMAWRVEQAKQAGIPFGIEAHLGSVVPRPRAALRLIKQVPGLTLTLDYTHFAYMGIPDIEVAPLIAHASHFHCRGGRKGRIQCSFTENCIDYPQIIRELHAVEYRGYICLEYVWIDWKQCNQTDNLSETILFRDLLQSL